MRTIKMNRLMRVVPCSILLIAVFMIADPPVAKGADAVLREALVSLSLEQAQDFHSTSDKEAFIKTFVIEAIGVLTAENAIIAPDAANSLLEVVSEQRVLNDYKKAPERQELLSRNTRQLIKRLVEMEPLDEREKRRITESSIQRLKRVMRSSEKSLGLCPLWPFC